MEKAQIALEKAIEADTRNGTRWSLAMDYLASADLLEKGQTGTKVRNYLGKALEAFKECGADGWSEEVERRLKARPQDVSGSEEVRLGVVP